MRPRTGFGIKGFGRRPAGLSALLALVLATGAHAGVEPAVTLRQALVAACEAPAPSSLKTLAERIPGAAGTGDEPLMARGMEVGWKRRFRLDDGGQIHMERFAPGGRLRRLVAEYWSTGDNGAEQPHLAAIAGPDCSILAARRLLYEPGFPHPVSLAHLDADLEETGEREPLNPPVPTGSDPGGVPVALVDAGVNYLLPEIAGRLARDDAGASLGHDYWERHGRPFDANPARSPFFPQRHGTRTASLLLREAPQAALVPYRYPRPDMSRMTTLVDDAADKGIVVVNMSLGSSDRGDWESFEQVARAHPQMLFVLSAGNNGRDIDTKPVYPAALALDNTITVTSSEKDGALAIGSNWGRTAVDLLVPAEGIVVTGYDGGEIAVAGSSYAAVRISALAARLLAAHPGWRAAELRQTIFARVLPAVGNAGGRVAEGFMPRPDKAEELPPLTGAGGKPAIVARHTLASNDLYRREPPADGHVLQPTLAYFTDTNWNLEAIRGHARQAAAILRACNIVMPEVTILELNGPPAYRYWQEQTSIELVNALALPTPTAYFVRDTLQVDAYDAEAIGKRNSAGRPGLRYTLWLTEALPEPGIALAHELAHLLMDSGRHVDHPGNLMQDRTDPANTTLTPEQCRSMVETGTANGLLNGKRKMGKWGQTTVFY